MPPMVAACGSAPRSATAARAGRPAAVAGGEARGRWRAAALFLCAVGVAHVHWLPSPMTADEQLLYEARVRPRQAVIAGVAAAALIAASVTQLIGPHSKVNELTI